MTKATKRRGRKRRLLVVLILLLLFKPVDSSHGGGRPVEEERRKTRHSVTAHAKWLQSGTESDAQAFVMEAIKSGEAARAVPGFLDHYQRILSGDKAALENTSFNWNDAAEFLDQRMAQGF